MLNIFSTRRFYHRFAGPPSPNLEALKEAIISKLHPICFRIKNDSNYATYVHDEHFYGIICSPLFEDKSYAEINQMVQDIIGPLGLKGKVTFNCQPPSRFHVCFTCNLLFMAETRKTPSRPMDSAWLISCKSQELHYHEV
ncbi:BolA-like superfamily [Babesia duncani]|uniref:BolA-like superfamily n=1 Tax=Babesia duncani TaxID=323732 RepID=A0AAD9UMN0_9APIC|nr:BolA-like superfamily [Babesia duncani]